MKNNLKNRAIEFRVWKLSTKNWATDDWFEYNLYHGNSVLDLNDDSYIFQQFTGLTDKNGKNIFEGDIVKFNKSYFEIIFENGAFCGRMGGGGDSFPLGWKAEMTDYTNCDTFKSEWIKKSELVGNIFENPELLK